MTARTSSLERSTRETRISVDLNIDGTGKFDVTCDIQFLKQASASETSNLLSSRRSVLRFSVLSVRVSPPAAIA